MLSALHRFTPPLTLAGAALAGLSAAQSSAPTVIHEFPEGASQCVASEAGLIAAGSGSTVLLLTEQTNQLARLTDGAGQRIELRPGGFVTGVALTSQRLYVAAGRRGVVPYERATWSESLTGAMELPPVGSVGPYERVVSLEVAALPSGGDLVVVGTDGDDIDGVGCSDPLNPACNDGQRDGRLLVFDTSLPAGLQLVGQYHTGKAVDALVVRSELYAGQVTILVATACGSLAAFHVNKANPSLPLPTVFTQPSLAGSYARDMVLHTNPSGQTRLYLASYAEQVRAFAVSLGAGPQNLSFSEVLGSGWPLAFPGTISSGKQDYASSLALDGGGTRLAVGYSVRFAEERQFSPGCPTAVICTGASTTAEQEHLGVWVYDVASFAQAPALLALIDSLTSDPDHDIRGHGVAFRESTAASMVLDVAGQVTGIGTFAFANQAGVWALNSHSWWDQDDNLTLPTNDVIWLQDNTLFSGTEELVVPYDLAASGGPLSKQGFGDESFGCSVGVTGFPAPDPRVFGFGTDGFSIFRISSTNPLRIEAGQGRVDVHGNIRLGKAMYGLQNGSFTNPPPRWLVLPIIAEDRGSQSFQDYGSLQLWNVGYATEPSDPAIKLLAKFVWQEPGCSTCVMRFFDADVRPISGTSAYLYASAMRGFKQTIPGNPPQVTYRFRPGLLRVRVDMELQPAPPGQLPIAKPVFHDPLFTLLGNELYEDGFQLWRVHFDPETNLIYGGFACAGVGVFSDPSPTEGVPPTLVGRRTSLPGPVFEVLAGPGEALYVSLLEAGVAVLRDGLHPQTSPLDVYPTRVSAIGIVVDPVSPNRLYVADTLAGLLHLEFPASAFTLP